jgi:hypothetical protein
MNGINPPKANLIGACIRVVILEII